MKIITKTLRCDNGTENSLLSGIQPSLGDNHTDTLAGEKSFMYRKSTSNQRIEAYWGVLKKGWSKLWINYFKDIINEGIFNNSLDFHIDCLRFCFMDTIQKELDEITFEWNLHSIRKQNNT
jgi:hypothetical protein